MKKITGWACTLAAAMLLFPCGANAERPKLTRALVEAGRASYVAHCTSCHGTEGRGDGPAARALEARPFNLRADGYRLGRKAPEVFATVGAGVGKAMPAFASLPERERWALAYRVLLLHAAGRTERVAAPAAVALRADELR